MSNYEAWRLKHEQDQFFPEHINSPDLYFTQLKRLDFLERKLEMEQKINKIQM